MNSGNASAERVSFVARLNTLSALSPANRLSSGTVTNAVSVQRFRVADAASRDAARRFLLASEMPTKAGHAFLSLPDSAGGGESFSEQDSVVLVVRVFGSVKFPSAAGSVSRIPNSGRCPF